MFGGLGDSMRKLLAAGLIVIVGTGLAAAVAADEQQRDVAIYVDKYEDPVIKEMEDENDALKAAAAAKTAELLEAYNAAQKARTEPEQQLRFDLDGLVKPESPEAFSNVVWHFPPTPQYLTGTCWSFSATSFIESEIHRLHGDEIKLSEMWTAYWEFVEKARGFIASRGESLYDHGSESAALLRVYRDRGVVPRVAYEGVVGDDSRFNHDLMVEHVRAFLGWCKDRNYWDEEVVIAMVRELLDATMGRPPETVEWNGETWTPKAFLSDVCGIDPDDYVSVMSTLSVPFWTRGEYAVPDNWWHDASYINVPLDVWYDTIVRVISSGRSLVIGGDVSEPGLNGFEDVAVVPTFDIPDDFIDQSSREFRFANGSTTDDHGIHLVGHTRLDGHDWFLIKDSNRSSRHGEFEGYYFYRDDYVRLKMLTFTVSKDAIPEILANVEDNQPVKPSTVAGR
jgi:bleomycin hydrolase